MLRGTESIEHWMRDLVHNAGATPYNDLHIDTVDPAFAPKTAWLAGVKECLSVAIRLRDQHKWQVTVGAGLLLLGGGTRLGVNFSSWEALGDQLDDSPPSLYVFDRDKSALLGDPDVKVLSGQYVPSLYTPLQSLMREWYDVRDRVYRRSFWLLG